MAIYAATASEPAQRAALFENFDGSAWSITPDYRLIAANSLFQQLCIVRLGRPLAAGESVLHPAFGRTENDFWRAWYDRALAGEVCAVEVTHPGVEDEMVIECHLNPIREADGRISGVVAHGVDVTERQRQARALQEANARLEAKVAARTAELEATVARLRQADAAKDAFLAAVSHELRTPLTGILAMTEALEANAAAPLLADPGSNGGPGSNGHADGHNDPNANGDGHANGDRPPTGDRPGVAPALAARPHAHRYVAALRESSDRLLATVNNVLLYTSLAAGRHVPQRERFCLSEVCHLALQSVAPKARHKRQHLGSQVTLGGDTLCDTVGDAAAIRRILEVLLDNAVKFTPAEGHIRLSATLGSAGDPDGSPGGRLHLCVSDDGIGMSAAQVAQLFQPFQQVDAGLDRQFEGLGLGLACVHRLVALLDGEIHIDSTPGVGTTVTVIVP